MAWVNYVFMAIGAALICGGALIFFMAYNFPLPMLPRNGPLYVSENALPRGKGSIERPFRTIQEAVDAANRR